MDIENQHLTEAKAFESLRTRRKITGMIGVTLMIVVLVAVASGQGQDVTNSTDMNHQNTKAGTFTQRMMAEEPMSTPLYDWQCSKANNVSKACKQSVRKIDALHVGLAPPDHLMPISDWDDNTPEPVVQSGDFKVSKYFDKLKRLSLEKGRVLEYVYNFDGWGGYPILYVRQNTSQPFANFSEWQQASCSSSCKNYLDDIVVSDTPEGYMQFVTLAIMGDQFYLWWHALYNDYQIVWSQQKMEEILKTLPQTDDGYTDDLYWISTAEAKLLRGTDFTPTVKCDAANPNIVRVQVVVFTKWGGFIRRTFKLKRNKGSGPRIMNIRDKTLLEYSVDYVY